MAYTFFAAQGARDRRLAGRAGSGGHGPPDPRARGARSTCPTTSSWPSIAEGTLTPVKSRDPRRHEGLSTSVPKRGGVRPSDRGLRGRCSGTVRWGCSRTTAPRPAPGGGTRDGRRHRRRRTVVGGGDSAAALAQFGRSPRRTTTSPPAAVPPWSSSRTVICPASKLSATRPTPPDPIADPASRRVAEEHCT